MPERRASPRVPLEVRAAVEIDGTTVHGWLCGFSQTGARIEYTGVTPAIGARVRVQLWIAEDDEQPLELLGRVVRHTEWGGFAVRFEAADARLKRGLSDLALQIAELPTL